MITPDNSKTDAMNAMKTNDEESVDSTVGDPAGGKRPPAREQLVALVHGKGCENRVQLWHTPSSADGYATVTIGDHHENHGVRSTVFRDWLMMEYKRKYGQIPYGNALREGIDAIDAVARCGDSDEHEIHLRVAEHAGSIFIDLGDPQWRAIKVTPDGWEVISNPPIKFKRGDAMQALPEPVDGGLVDELSQFVNVASDTDLKLLIGWALFMFCPTGPYPVLILNGEAGSAKSTTAKIIRRLVDPSKSDIRSSPSSERDLAVAACHSWVVAFDNLSGIKQSLSDAVCQLATGGGFGTRRLYTDANEMLFQACRPVILNGIDSLVTPGGHNTDLFDRAIVLDLPAIGSNRRRTDRQLWSDFEAAAPRILGAFLDAVSTALSNLAETKLSSLPRMADFALWVTAAEPALGWDEGSFNKALWQSHHEAEADSVEASVIYLPITRLLEQQKGMWRGTATELLEDLGLQVQGNVPADWPCNATRLSSDLTRLKKAFAQMGVQIDRGKKDGSRYIDIRQVLDGAGRPPDTQPCPIQPTRVGSDGTDAGISSIEKKGKKGRVEGGTTLQGNGRPRRPASQSTKQRMVQVISDPNAPSKPRDRKLDDE